MAELIAKTPCDGLLPITSETVSLTELTPSAITSFMPYKGREKAASTALKKACGMALPGPNEASGTEGARAIWSGRGQCFILDTGVPADLATEGAITDQSDAWAVMQLAGAGAQDVLARLVPVDLRLAAFKPGQTVRTEMQHMMASITRSGDTSFDIMVMRSFAKTAVHDLHEAMKSVAARG
ncbi:sarcosine oxidase subunit gamma [Halocynthiibacter styelae]|uniref:Sarcosine oxidase subunit gamma n=1 Tax=Halocynthiibacter styelae TaxID=2761955 RepID=A0A8J7IVT9_9RHOB|nr:sarcosine oxidase subunit gamma [Paenihalocynthiibacter styelae]MBI1493519.1 sarcosine oxidase subunit gamma [Paenihalocynthiibacter styelae]